MVTSRPRPEPVEEKIHAALTPDLYATDEAYRLVREEGMSFAMPTFRSAQPDESKRQITRPP